MAAVGEALASRVRSEVTLAGLTSLGVGGPARAYLRVETERELADAASAAQRTGAPHFVLAGGSNLCISDRGIPGLVIHNCAADCRLGPTTRAASGHSLMALVLKTATAGLSGLEFAVGIPGSVGGALVSNAGAYRRSIAPLIAELTIASEGHVRSVRPEWMEFGYRDSRLRRSVGVPQAERLEAPPACLVAADLRLEPRPRGEVLNEARAYQANRIHRQPWARSAGSFFKNVYDSGLACRVAGLPEELRAAGVVPAGFLSEACGCRGLRFGGAQVSARHGNFVVNTGSATASEVRRLAEEVKRRVREAFGVELEEEVIYAGDWSE